MEATSKNTMGQLSRLLGRPKSSSGLEDERHDWSLAATAATLVEHASTWMDESSRMDTEITLDQGNHAAARVFSRQLYTLLTYLLALVRGAPDHNGLEAWRLLHEWYQPKTRSRGLAFLNEILGWDSGEGAALAAHEI